MKCIVTYLIRGDQKSLGQFEKSIALLAKNFLPWNPADILVFHEDNVASNVIAARCKGLNVRFAKVDFSVHPDLANLQAMSFGGWGYRHMCHFFANDLFLRKEMDGYDYQMRMDDDSFILSPIGYNVFEEMNLRQAHYAYRVIDFDFREVCIDLWETAISYFRSHQELCVRELKMPPPYPIYYTNFEINDLHWFRGRLWQDFFAAIDRTGGIWRLRWGDAPIRYLGVQGLLSDNQILCVKSLHYAHQSEWRSGLMIRLPWDNVDYFLKVPRMRLSLAIRRFLRGFAK